MITEQELYSVVATHPNVKAAFDRAIEAMTEMACQFKRPGLWAKVRLAGLMIDRSRAISALLTVYGTATGCRRPASDLDCIEKIVFMAAKHPDRSFHLLMCAIMGVSYDSTCAEKPSSQAKADQPNQEVVDAEFTEAPALAAPTCSKLRL